MRKKAKWAMLLTYPIISFVLVLGLAGNASATAYTWDDGGDANLWSDANNWQPDGTVTASDTAKINTPDSNTLISSPAVCTSFTLGYDAGPCYLYMNPGGSLTTTETCYVGDDPDANGVFVINGGSLITGAARLRIAYGKQPDPDPFDPTYGTLIMSGGDVNVGGKLELAKNDSAYGDIYMSGGTIHVGYVPVPANEDFEFATHGTGNLYMTGGLIDIDDKLRVGAADDGTVGTGHIYLDGGTLFVDNYEIGIGDTSFIDISGGTLHIGGGSSIVEQLVGEGKIKAYGGSGTVDINSLPGGTETWVTARPGDPNQAYNSNPINYATVEWTPGGPTLSWNAASEGHAVSHDVYFDTNSTDVNDANNALDVNSNPVWTAYRGNQGANTTFAFPSPPPPNLGQTYYWRIDEVNEDHNDSPWKGVVWEFTIEEYEVVEDFESYSPSPLTNVWTLTGPAGTSISVEGTIVHSDDQSMKYVYDTNVGGSPPFYTEAVANTTGVNKLPVDIQDWTTAEIRALVLYFYGRGDNDAEKMYVALKDTDGSLATVYYDDPNDLNEPEWHEWNIDLNDFNEANDVNISSIDKVYVGFGNRENPTGGGAGTVYFDDIRLHPQRCVPVFGPLGDITGGGEDEDRNCYVDINDVNVMAFDWLQADSTRKGSDAELKGGVTWVLNDPDTDRRPCIELDGVNDWVDLDDTDFSNFRNKTITFWAKILSYTTDARYLFFFSNGDFLVGDEDPYRIYFMPRDPDEYTAWVRFVDEYTEDFHAYGLWHLLTFTIEDTPEGCVGTLYVDDEDWDDIPDKPRHYGGASGVNIGSSDDGEGGFVNARIDDFRVYDKVLNLDEVEDLYNGTPPDANMLVHYAFDEGSGTTAGNSSSFVFYHPVLSDAELYKDEPKNSRSVNFRDFAVLANDWLKEILWPLP